MSTNQPPVVNVVYYNNIDTTIKVYPVLATQVLGPQDGSDLGTGTGEVLMPPGGISVQQWVGSFVIEFLEDRYAMYLDQSNNDPVQRGGIFRRGNGGTGGDGWGLDIAWPGTPTSMSNFVVHHPNGVPMLSVICSTSSLNSFWHVYTTDGVNWTADPLVSGNTLMGETVVWNSRLVFAHSNAGGLYGQSYDPVTTDRVSLVLTGINASTGNDINLIPHEGNLYAFYPTFGNHGFARLEGTNFNLLSQFGLGQFQGSKNITFVDPYSSNTDGSKDLIFIGNANTFGARCAVIDNLTTGAFTDITNTIFGDGSTYDGGAGIGADRYRQGGVSVNNNRHFNVITDTRDYLNPKVFIWTWVATSGIGSGSIECWEWRGQNNELEAVNGLTGISSNFATPSNPFSHSLHGPVSSRIEIGDEFNPPIEDVGGTRFYFRAHGSSAAGTVTFYGTDKQQRPEDVVPIIGGSLVVESGSPPTTPSISGNTITNLTPDDGATLYSVVLDVDASGIDITEGEFGLLVGDIQ